MRRHKTAIVNYESSEQSVPKAVELVGGFIDLKPGDRVFVKPNIVFWTRAAEFPKWGVITTSTVVEQIVALLKDHGIDDITIGEGMVLLDAKDTETPAHAFKSLGYDELSRRYGVKYANLFQHPYEQRDLGDGVSLKFSSLFLESDYVVNVPVMKTHSQTVVSLGIKNIKGCIDIPSRKKCHGVEPGKDLHFMVSKLIKVLPRSFTLIDGIYTIERGPGPDGKARRSNLLVASNDVLAADKVGSKLLGYEPEQVPHLAHAARDLGRPADPSDVEVVGERLEDCAKPHEFEFAYNDDGTLPLPMEKMGIRGVSYPKYDLTLCTYCSILTGAVLASIAFAWRGTPWHDVEVLTGKQMAPTPGKRTVLLGNCLYKAHKDHPEFDKMIAIKTCPPSIEDIIGALHQVGIEIDPSILRNIDKAPAFYMKRYEGKSEFDESFFHINGSDE